MVRLVRTSASRRHTSGQADDTLAAGRRMTLRTFWAVGREQLRSAGLRGSRWIWPRRVAVWPSALQYEVFANPGPVRQRTRARRSTTRRPNSDGRCFSRVPPAIRPNHPFEPVASGAHCAPGAVRSPGKILQQVWTHSRERRTCARGALTTLTLGRSNRAILRIARRDRRRPAWPPVPGPHERTFPEPATGTACAISRTATAPIARRRCTHW